MNKMFAAFTVAMLALCKLAAPAQISKAIVVGHSSSSAQSKPAAPPPGPAGESIAVSTYHYDNLRTGWNQSEIQLTPKNVSINTANTSNCSTQSCFGLLHLLTLDEQVDGQPLLVPNVTIGSTTHNVVYVATENNSIYGIDAVTGEILVSMLQLGAGQIGPPVPQADVPQGPYDGNTAPFTSCPDGPNAPCNNFGSAWSTCGVNNLVGITSTPVIDPTRTIIYLITYNLNASTGPTYYLHALNVATLNERVGSPVPVLPTFTLKSGTTVYFKGAVQRQRPALLWSGGNIYAAFGSHCDYAGDQSRGWLLGWNATILQPLPQIELTNQGSNPPVGSCAGTQPCFLSSIWMSGFGPAADASGNVFFVTGNSLAGTYQSDFSKPNVNLSESVIQVSPDLSAVKGFFTPLNPATLDGVDNDFGAGGVLLLPDQPGITPHLAVAAGKDGNMYLLNRDNLGGAATSSSPVALSTVKIGGTHDGPSYFTGSGGVGRIVSSGGNQVMVWKVVTSPSVGLTQDTAFSAQQFPVIGGGPNDPGHDTVFFTIVSSNGTNAGTAIIWAVQRPIDNTNNYTWLYAYDAGTGASLIGSTAATRIASGTWPNPGSNYNLGFLVANGKVYVATYKQLAIFGLGATGSVTIPAVPSPSGQPAARRKRP